jgi:hypothetical protein
MRTQPGAQQRPDTFHRVDMHLMAAIAVLVPCVLAMAVADALMEVAPLRQTVVDIIFCGNLLLLFY